MLNALTFELSKVEDLGVRERIRDLMNEVDHELATSLARNIGVKPPGQPKHKNSGQKSKFLSMIASPYTPMDSIATRRVAVIVGDGYSGDDLKALRAILTEQGAKLAIVGTHKGYLYADGAPGAADMGAKAAEEDGKPHDDCVKADFTIFNSKSVLFDSVALIGGSHTSLLQANGNVKAFVAEALKHCKAVMATGNTIPLLTYPCQVAGITLSDGSDKLVNDQAVVTSGKQTKEVLTAFVEAMKLHRCWDRKGVDAIPA